MTLRCTCALLFHRTMRFNPRDEVVLHRGIRNIVGVRPWNISSKLHEDVSSATSRSGSARCTTVGDGESGRPDLLKANSSMICVTNSRNFDGCP